MLIYSETIVSFIKVLTKDLIKIMREECNLDVKKTRFFFQGFLYPFSVVVFEDPSTIGYFDPHALHIGINKKLMYTAHKEVIRNVLKHELLHYLCWITHGDSSLNHQLPFRKMAEQYKFNKDVYLANINVNSANNNVFHDQITESLLNKIKKLLQLATSTNTFEAESATIKANQLLLAHNIKQLDTFEKEEEICLKRVLHGQKNNAKFRAIYEILKTFFVTPVFNHGSQGFYLEIIGTRTNVELADYVGNFLAQELEQMYFLAKKENPGIHKASYMKGIANGYCSKIKTVQTQTSGHNAIVKIEQNLCEQAKIVYRKLSSLSIKNQAECERSKKLGNLAGQKLSIKPAIRDNSVSPRLLSPC